jgi:hypothetical protein
MHIFPVTKLVSAGVAASLALAGSHAAAPASPRVELSVRIIDRAGKLAKPLDLQLMNLARPGGNIDLGQGTSRSVPPGRYNVAAEIGPGSGGAQTVTLADRIVNVTRNTTITLDARQGRLFQVSLDAPGAVREVLELTAVVDGSWAFNPGMLVVLDPAQSVYVVPMTARAVTFYAYSVWERPGSTPANPSPFRYDIINVYRGGLPAHPSFTVRKSSLAKISITVRATDQGQQATLFLLPMSAGGQNLPFNDQTTLGATPARLVAYRSPGYQWQPIVDLQSPAGEISDTVVNMNPYGHGRFTERYFAAVLSPQHGGAFAGAQNQTLQAGIIGSPLGDPLHPDSTGQGSGLTTTLQLFSGSRLLASSHGPMVQARIPLATRWYDLHLDAARNASATLSTQIHAIWHFPLHGTSHGIGISGKLYQMQLLPAGLDGLNRAASGITTPVSLRVFSSDTARPLLLHVVRAQESADDGQTWQHVTIRIHGDHYLLSVPNPPHAGFVSLRLYVKDSTGVSEQLTVLHAYAVK